MSSKLRIAPLKLNPPRFALLALVATPSHLVGFSLLLPFCLIDSFARSNKIANENQDLFPNPPKSPWGSKHCLQKRFLQNLQTHKQ
jgi:hypothetical protein